jgi:predicted trehalose synthase
MLRSFHYAAHKGFQDWAARKAVNPEVAGHWRDQIRVWKQSVCSRFVFAYIHRAQNASFLPSSPTTTAALLDVCLLNKAIYELGYELNSRPDWVSIPLEGVLEILGN